MYGGYVPLSGLSPRPALVMSIEIARFPASLTRAGTTPPALATIPRPLDDDPRALVSCRSAQVSLSLQFSCEQLSDGFMQPRARLL